MFKKKYFPNKTLICGLGSIGKRYLDLLINDWPETKIAVLSSKRFQEIPNYKRIDFISNDLKKCINWKPQAVFICNAAPSHIEYAINFLSRKIPVFIEKPLGSGYEDSKLVNRLINLSENCTVLLGYVLRHEPAYKYILLFNIISENLTIKDIINILNNIFKFLYF